jgi:hypothetical protein
VAPAPGQEVDLVFPALECVAVATCERVDNDVPGLVARSIRVTTPRRTPVQSWFPSGYVIEGLGLRLTGPLVSAGERNSEAFVPGLTVLAPLDLGKQARRWRVSDASVYLGEVEGRSITVRTRRGGGVNVQGSIETRRYTEQGNGSAEVFDGSINTGTRGQVTYRRTALNLIEARLGPLELQDVELKLTSAQRPNRVRGPVTLDADTRMYLQTASADHPMLKASGALELGGARLEGQFDCTDAKPGRPFTVLRGSRVSGQLSDDRGRPLPNGAVLDHLTTFDWCADQVVRLGYTRRSVTFTLLDAP